MSALGWEVSCYRHRLAQGLVQKGAPCSMPCSPLICTRRSPKARRVDAGSIHRDFLQGAGGFALQCWDKVSRGALCLMLRLRGHTRAPSLGQPPALGSPLLPPKRATQIPTSSRQCILQQTSGIFLGERCFRHMRLRSTSCGFSVLLCTAIIQPPLEN